MNALSDRLAAIDVVFADPPQVHFTDATYGLAPAAGVWHAHRTCYEFLASLCDPGARTLETGLGVSTALFTMWGCRHTSVVHHQNEADALMDYLRARSIDVSTLTLHVGESSDVLPALAMDPLDVAFVDGGHGFPTAILDWFYAGSRLRAGGALVLDDLDLPSVTLGLLDFLAVDDRWTELHRIENWGAWRRETSGSLGESWTRQPFLTPLEREKYV
jgi:predicted O-methyltransferase YrrM